MDKRSILAILLLGAGVASCRMRAELGPGVPLAGGSVLEGEIDPIGGTGTIPPQEGLPAGTCVKLTFFGAGGVPLGSTEVTAGESFEVPPGAEGGTVEPCDPPAEPEKKGKRKRRAGTPVQFIADDPETFAFRYIPFGVTTGPSLFAEFVVTASSRAQAEPIRDEFVLGLLSEPPPAEVEPLGVVQVDYRADGSVEVAMFSLEAPASLQFDWNGSSLFTLADAAVTADAGWYATRVVVPASLVESDWAGTSENALTYRLGLSAGDEVGTSLSLTVDP